MSSSKSLINSTATISVKRQARWKKKNSINDFSCLLTPMIQLKDHSLPRRMWSGQNNDWLATPPTPCNSNHSCSRFSLFSLFSGLLSISRWNSASVAREIHQKVFSKNCFSEFRPWMLSSRTGWGGGGSRIKLRSTWKWGKKKFFVFISSLASFPSFHHQSIISRNGIFNSSSISLLQHVRQMCQPGTVKNTFAEALLSFYREYLCNEKPATAPLSRRTVSVHFALVRSRRTGNVCANEQTRRQLNLSLDLRRRPTRRPMQEGYCTLFPPACTSMVFAFAGQLNFRLFRFSPSHLPRTLLVVRDREQHF